MAYEKQNFLNGQIVTADNLNHMENGIIAAQNPRNLLDNSDFRNPVNQRGATSYSGVCYTIDRWRSWGESMQINVSNGEIIVLGGALYQYVLCEPSKTYTAAICLSDGTIICSSGVPSENGIGDYNTLWVDRSDNNLMFRIGFDAIEHKYVWAALYEGTYTTDTLPPYIPKGYAAELAECQRYFERKYSHIITKEQSSMYIMLSYMNKRIDQPTIIATTENYSEDNLTLDIACWNIKKNSASGTIGSVVVPENQAHWYGYFDISADL